MNKYISTTIYALLLTFTVTMTLILVTSASGFKPFKQNQNLSDVKYSTLSEASSKIGSIIGYNGTKDKLAAPVIIEVNTTAYAVEAMKQAELKRKAISAARQLKSKTVTHNKENK